MVSLAILWMENLSNKYGAAFSNNRPAQECPCVTNLSSLEHLLVSLRMVPKNSAMTSSWARSKEEFLMLSEPDNLRKDHRDNLCWKIIRKYRSISTGKLFQILRCLATLIFIHALSLIRSRAPPPPFPPVYLFNAWCYRAGTNLETIVEFKSIGGHLLLYDSWHNDNDFYLFQILE